MGCTTFAVVPPATSDGQVYLSWNLDVMYPTKLILDRCKLFVVPHQPYSYVCFGVPGIGGIGLMNETGLSAVGNAVGMKDGIPRGKLGWVIMADLVKNCANIEEVVEYLEKTPRMAVPGCSASIFLNVNTLWADSSGNGALVEYSGNHLAIKPIEETGFLVETNHHQVLDRQKSGSTDPSQQEAIIGSYARLGRAWELAKKWKGQFDLAKVKEFTSDHGLNYDLLKEFGIHPGERIDDATICCHYWNYHNYMQENRVLDAVGEMLMGKTLMSFILEPIKKRVHWCPDNPCRTAYKCYDVARSFKKADEIKQKKSFKASKDILDVLNRPLLKNLLYWTFYSLDRLIPM